MTTMDPKVSPAHAALRIEVMAGDVRFEDLLEDDQWFVESEVAKLAKERGISLD